MFQGKRRVIVSLLAAGVALGWVRSRRRAVGGVDAHRHEFSGPGAAVYDVLARPALGRFFRGVARDLAALAPAGREFEVLEVGCGPGHLAATLAGVAPTARVTGLDLSPDMVARAGALAERRGLAGRLSFWVGDVAVLPFADATFDAVVSTFSAHHWEQPVESLAQIRRVLRPGGVARIYDLAGWITRSGQREPAIVALATGDAGSGASRLVTRLGPLPLVYLVELRRDPSGDAPGAGA